MDVDLPRAVNEALSAPPLEQPRLLAPLAQQLAANVEALRHVFPTLVAVITSPPGRAPPATLLWAANLYHLALSTPQLNAAVKTPLALQSLGALGRMLKSQNADLEKIGLSTFASTYPLLFREASASTDQAFWTAVVDLKAAALHLWRSGGPGPKVTSIKLLQRIIQTQTKGTADPRLQRTAEPNLTLIRPNHPYLRLNLLEDEANKLLEELVTSLFTSSSPDLVSAAVLALTGLVKMRPQLVQLIVTALVNWSPAALVAVGRESSEIKSTEKTVRIALNHLLKTSHASGYTSQITEFLNLQAGRMDVAATQARQAREAEASRKRQLISDELSSSKRRKVDAAGMVDAVEVFRAAAQGSAGVGAEFDASSLAADKVVELLVSSLQNVPVDQLEARIQDVRRSLPKEESILEGSMAAGEDAKPLDPLKADLGEDELEMKAEVPQPEAHEDEEEEDQSTQAATFDFNLAEEGSLVAPQELPASAKTSMMEAALRRICAAGSEGAGTVWAPLGVRLVTRAFGETMGDEEEEERREKLRLVMYEFVVEDLKERMEFARLWLNEEWYVDTERSAEGRPYERWTNKLLQHIMKYSTNKDKSFAQFIVDLPSIPRDAVTQVGDMCLNPNQVHLGFAALKDLALLRPPARQAALDVLLGLTSHPDKLTRNASINTLKRWVPEVPVLSAKIMAYSKLLFTRLENAPPPPTEEEAAEVKDEGEEEADMDVDSDDEENEKEKPPPPRVLALVVDGEIVDGLPAPSTMAEILQHVELIFALSVKDPELLGHVFESYGRLQPFAQEAIQALIVPVIKSLGPTNVMLGEQIKMYPKGSDALILRVINILMDKSTRLPLPLIPVVKQLAVEREGLNPRLTMLIIAECEKVQIAKFLPSIVALLNGTPEQKAQVRSIFLSVIAAPSQQFGSGHNAPGTRVRELLTPVELLVLLHTSEKEIGIKQSIEAISICFSMPDAFRPETWVSFMTHISDQPVIPVLFLRTVIQAVTTYKTIQAFVSTTLLSRLIAKNVWTTAPLWEGFIRLAKTIAPNSFSSLLLLPVEQFHEVVMKQPSLKEPLRAFLNKKTGALKAKVAGHLEALGPEEEVDAEVNSGMSTPIGIDPLSEGRAVEAA
ncbi:hypothetical protein MNV49_000365 [Pseudohyphozyma bogoriensis]|nr:hypothetical protein MNV49_000365 [Pseudohyphozyma bogoriensis]